jgi:adenylate kinase family enzyme
VKKIAVFGLPGTGKTTLSRDLSIPLGLPHTDLDDILFTPSGALPLDEFRAAASAITEGETWIVEGNFSKLADVVWRRADVLVWLDYPLALIEWRIIRRSLRQLTGREPGNWRTALLGPRATTRSVIRKYRHNRPRYTRQAAETAALGVTVLRFRSPRQAARWAARTATTGRHRAP